MPYRIEIASVIPDTRARVLKDRLCAKKIKNIVLLDVYTIDKALTNKQLKKIASMLTTPEIQSSIISSTNSKKTLNFGKFSYAIEIGFLPGVTDNIGATVQELIEDLLGIRFINSEAVYASQVVFVFGSISKSFAEKISRCLYNPLIQRSYIKNYETWKKDKGMDVVVPKVKLITKPKVDEVDLNVNDEELILIGKQGIANSDGTRRGPLALDLLYMKTIQKYFQKKGRNPTDIELESIAQTWSEHCKHTIFADPIDNIKNGLYKTYIKAATEKIRKAAKHDICISVFTDNSGGIEFDNDWIITDKVETHNSPSAMDPFGGSITGIIGVNRDTLGFGLGAKPIINRYGFCFAPPGDKSTLYKGGKKTQKMLSAKRIMNGVIDGVNSGGNCSGIPTTQGFVFFDSRYRGKPLVYVGTVGLIPRKLGNKLLHVKKALPEDLIVVIGGKVGKDGIHGATFSSEIMDAGSPAGAVQIGDPITQKKLSDAIVKEARDLGLYNSITDNGAGGISCSVAEMAKESGGCIVNLEKVPLKYPGLAPWEIWISESQERMTLAVPKHKWKRFLTLMKKRGVRACVIGKFTRNPKCIVVYNGETIMDVDMDFLHNGLPSRPMKTRKVKIKHKEPQIPKKNNLNKLFLALLKRPNIASFSFISQQYDHEVQGGSVIKPLQGKGMVNGDATVVRPLLNSKKGIIVSQGLNPTYGDIDTYHMAACAIDTAIRSAVVIGAKLDHLALLDNFCWCSSEKQERLYQLKQAARACFDYAVAFATPFISGKDSMFNDFKGFDKDGKPLKISIPPTLLISSIGVMKDISRAISLDAKFAGDLVYVLGETHDELGGSEYYAPHIGNNVPKVNAKKNKKLYQTFSQAVEKSLISSAQSVSRGGLAVALAKTAMGGMLGIDVSLKQLKGRFTRDDFAIFSESQGRIVVTINPDNKSRFEKKFKRLPFSNIGKVTDNGFITVRGKDNSTVVKTSVKKALQAYRVTFEDY